MSLLKTFLEVTLEPDDEGNMMRLCVDMDLIMFIYEGENNMGILEIYRPKTGETELIKTASTYDSITTDLRRLSEIEVS